MSASQTFDDKVDNAVHAAFTALGLSVENHVPVANILNGYFTDIFGRLVTSDEDEGDGEPDWSCPRCSETLQDGSGVCITCGEGADENEDDICDTCKQPYEDGGDGYDGECPDCADRTYQSEVISRCAPRWAWELMDETLEMDANSCAFDQALRERISLALKALILSCENPEIEFIPIDDPALRPEVPE